MHADGYLFMFSSYNFVTLFLSMVIHFLESMPTNILIILIAASVFALASKVNALESSQEALSDAMTDEISSAIVDIETVRRTSKPPTEDPNTAILTAILERMTQLEAQRLRPSTSPPPRLSLSDIRTQDTPSMLPTYRKPSLAISGVVSQATTPHHPPSVRLGLSTVAGQATAPAAPRSPVFQLSSTSSQSATPKSPKLQVLSFAKVQTVSTEPVYVPRQKLIYGIFGAQMTVPVSVQVPKLSTGKIKAVSTTPLWLIATLLRFSKIVILDECTPTPMSTESRMIVWWPKSPEVIIKKLIEQKFQAQSMLEKTGSYYALELQSMQHKFEGMRAKFFSLCLEDTKQKSQIADLMVRLESVRVSEFVLKDKLDECVDVIRVLKEAGIDVDTYIMLSKQARTKGKSKPAASTKQAEAKPGLTTVPISFGTGLNASAFSFNPKPLSATPEATLTHKQATSSSGGGLGASKWSSESSSKSPVQKVAPTTSKSTGTTSGGLGASKRSAESKPEPPTQKSTTVTSKYTGTTSGGLGASKWSVESKVKSSASPTMNKTAAKYAVKDEPATPAQKSKAAIPPTYALGDSVNMDDWQEEKYCDICQKVFTIEFDIETNNGKKFFVWTPHEMNFHGKCHDYHKVVSAIWNSKDDTYDFNEHRKVCPVNWATCRDCHTKVFAHRICTPRGPMNNFSEHNTTCRVKVKMTRILFHCKNCGEGITNKSDFFDNHHVSCAAQAALNNTINAFDSQTGDFVGPGMAPQTPVAASRTAMPHGPMPRFGNQATSTSSPAAAASTSPTTHTPPTRPRIDHVSSSGRRPPMPKFGARLPRLQH
jgi:hypothetical protein